MNDWRDHHIRLLRDTCPEDLGTTPMYIMDWAALADSELDTCRAFTGGAVDLLLRPYLTEAGQWQGRGVGVVVDRVGLSERHLAGVLAHEVSHFLSDPAREVIDEQGLDALLHAAGKPDDVAPLRFVASVRKTARRAPWAGHGLRFIRCCLHLWSRHPLDIPLSDLHVAGDEYGLSHPWFYREAFDQELHAHRCGSIRSLLQTPMPEPAQDLFIRDVERVTE